MHRLGFIGLSLVMAFVPLTFYWAMNRPATPRPGMVQSHPAYFYRYYGFYGGPRFEVDFDRHNRYRSYGGGHGGWLSSSYGWGRGGYDRYDRAGGASAYRGGGPGAGGK